MIIDATRLLLFPALMAFAASSDLLTMTISNKVSLALAAGFLILAPAAEGFEQTPLRFAQVAATQSCLALRGILESSLSHASTTVNSAYYS